MRSLYRRKFCLECSPFGEHNTSKKPAGARDDADAFRKRRRTDSWVRYLRKRRRERKERLIALRGGKCEDCGYGTSSAALEFHHRDARTKEFGIGKHERFMAPPSRRGGEMRPPLRQLPSSQTRVRDAFGFGTDFGARKEGARDRAHGRGMFWLRARRLVLDVRVPPLGCQRKELWYFAGRHGTTMGPDPRGAC